MKELAAKIQQLIESLYPDSYVCVEAKSVLVPSITIKFAVEKKDKWEFGIFQNSTKLVAMVWNVDENGVVVESGQPTTNLFSYIYNYGSRMLKTRNKKIATEDQLLEHIKKQFENLKPVIEGSKKVAS